MEIKNEIFNALEGVSCVSFDIFDTLLLRMGRKQQLIFEKTYKKNPALFPEYMNWEDWREVRLAAQQNALTLDDIYNKLPSIIQNRDEIKQNEIICEIENSFINSEIADLIYTLADKYNKNIILVADTYLSEDVIKKILIKNGLNISYIDKIFSSYNTGYTKSKGNLYDYVCKCLNCMPNEILHIGSSLEDDYIKAQKKGLKAIYYPVISESNTNYPFVEYEDDICDDLYSLRVLAAQNNLENEEKFWYELGAMVLGPFVTYAAEWVLNIAEQNGIHKIFSMMRDGKFLAAVLKNAQNARNWNGTIDLMYISRKSLYPALLSVFKVSDIECFFKTHKMTLGKLVKFLGIEQEYEQFERYYDIEIEATRNIYEDGESVYSKLQRTLCSEDLAVKIREKNKNTDEIIFKYFEQLGLTKESYITFDVGWRGNSQNAIERIMKYNNATTKGIHLLLNGKKDIAYQGNLEDSCDIRGFSGNFGQNDKYLSKFVISIFELFFGCDEGTTVGYMQKSGKIMPVMKNMPYPNEQLKMNKYVQQGVLSFQNKYYDLLSKGKTIKQNTKDLVKLMERLFVYPTKKEAKYIGNMYSEQNFGVDQKWQIIDKEKLEEYKKLGYSDFVFYKKARDDEWYQGMDACINGLANYKKLKFTFRNEIEYKYCLFVERLCNNVEEFVLVGAGKHFRDMMLFLNLLDETNKIKMVIDSNKLLEGKKICGQKIYQMGTEVFSKHFVITVLNPKIIDEISYKLKELYGQDIRIIHI